MTTPSQWPNLLRQPYPLAPYGGPPHQPYPPEMAQSGGPGHLAGYPPHMQPTYQPTPYGVPLDPAGPGVGAKFSSRARSMPPSSTRGARGYSHGTRGRSRGKKKDLTPSSSSPDPGTLASSQPSRFQPSRSIPRSGNSREGKPYSNPDQAREHKAFSDFVWDRAKHWFVLKLWREGCFFFKGNEKDATVDRCATEAYEAAISEYRDSYPDRVEQITKYRLQPQGTGGLVKCRQAVSGCYHSLCSLSLIRHILATSRSIFIFGSSSGPCAYCGG